jgi:hypothetical protein
LKLLCLKNPSPVISRYSTFAISRGSTARMTPAKIPPLVPQHMLRPTAANKMRNAVIEYRNFGGQLAESTFAPSDPEQIQHNNTALAAMLKGAIIVESTMKARARDALRTLKANTTFFSTDRLLNFLKAYRWFDPKSREASTGNPLKLQIEFLEGKAGDHGIKEWILFGPKVSTARGTHELNGTEFDVVYRSRHEQMEHRFNTYNDPVHRAFAQHICQQIVLPQADNELNALSSTHRGVMIYYPITDVKAGKTSKPPKGPFTVGFTLLFPDNDIVSPLGFTVRMPNRPEEAVITVGD